MLHITLEIREAICNAPAPKDVYALVILAVAHVVLKIHEPQNNLQHKNFTWKWTNMEQRAFNETKKLILKSEMVVHYNPTLPIHLACDSSSFGVKAVLSHKINGEYRLAAFASPERFSKKLFPN